MKKNLGTVDRIVRLILSLFLFYLGFFVFISYNIIFSLIAFIFALMLIYNSLMGYCGLYEFFGISTNKKCKVYIKENDLKNKQSQE